MTDDADANATSGPELSRVDVVLRIEAGRIDLPLGTIDTLSAGALLPLPGPPGRVDLIVHGTVIGTGRLVTVDDALAVEVLTLVAGQARSTPHPPSGADGIAARPEALSKCTGPTGTWT